MVDAEFVVPWIIKAENDIMAARFLAKTMHPIPTEIVCFHCQQAVEKYLKAFLAYNDQEPPKTHDLMELIKFCNTFDGGFLILSPKCEYLVPFAARTRYPGSIDPDEEDMKIALAYAEDIIELIKRKIPQSHQPLSEKN